MVCVMLSHGYFTKYLCFLIAGLVFFFLPSYSLAWVSLCSAHSRVPLWWRFACRRMLCPCAEGPPLVPTSTRALFEAEGVAKWLRRGGGRQWGFLCAVGGKLVVKFDLIYLIFWE